MASKNESKNENCLEGIRCPACEAEDEFKISGNAYFIVTDDGTNEFTDPEWDDDSYIECMDCHHVGVLADFRIENQEDEPAEGGPK